MSKELKQAVLNLLEDLTNIETCTVKTQDNLKADLCTYSKVELGGDAITYINENDLKEVAGFHSELVKISFQGRKAYWNFFIKALM